LPLAVQKRQSVQGQDGPDHVLPDPLGLGLHPGPHLAAASWGSSTPPGDESGVLPN
jgi:hypothetical protein